MQVPSLATEPEGPVLVSLMEAPGRQPWRKRSAIEIEDVELDSSEGGRCCRARLMSTASPGGPAPASIEFFNSSRRSCRIIWLDFHAREVPYTVLEAGTRAVYRSWADHLWIVRDAKTGRRMCIDGAQAVVACTTSGHLATITDAPPLRWHEHTHAAFPQQLHHEAQTLLLCWQRLSSAGSSGGGSGRAMDGCSAVADLGALDYGLVRKIIGEHLAPQDLWQEACTAHHPDIRPTQVHSLTSFDALLACSTQACGAWCSRLTADQLAQAMLPPPPSPPLPPHPAAASAPSPAAAPASPMHALAAALGGAFGALLSGGRR